MAEIKRWQQAEKKKNKHGHKLKTVKNNSAFEKSRDKIVRDR